MISVFSMFEFSVHDHARHPVAPGSLQIAPGAPVPWWRRSTTRIAYYLFDAPFLAGRDLRGVGNRDRRDLLEETLGNGTEHIRVAQRSKLHA